jgi:hypothetical protein
MTLESRAANTKKRKFLFYRNFIDASIIEEAQKATRIAGTRNPLKLEQSIFI